MARFSRIWTLQDIIAGECVVFSCLSLLAKVILSREYGRNNRIHFDNEPYRKLRHRHKNYKMAAVVRKICMATMGRNFLNDNILAKKEDIEL